jgi:hypothetical protein
MPSLKLFFVSSINHPSNFYARGPEEVNLLFNVDCRFGNMIVYLDNYLIVFNLNNPYNKKCEQVCVLPMLCVPLLLSSFP